MKIRVKKNHGWNGGILEAGREYNLDNDHAKMLIRDGIAESDEWKPNREAEIECATEEPREEMAVTGRPKPRRRRRNANSGANT